MDIKKIEKLINLLKGTDISEIEITEENKTIRITKPNINSANIVMTQQPVQTVMATSPEQPAPATITAPTPTETTTSPTGKAILSPMVGTFYAAPNPDAEPFITIGQKVKIGDPVCIVEAMKMFNKIESEVEGTIKSILLTDGDPVEFDQPLFEVE